MIPIPQTAPPRPPPVGELPRHAVPCLTPMRVATLCGVLPLAIGAAVFVTWLLSGWDLGAVGLATIAGGFLLFGAGGVAVFVQVMHVLDAPREDRPPMLRRAALATLVLAANIPAASILIRTAYRIDSAYVVTIVNETPLPLSDVTLQSERTSIDLGTLAPGQRVRRTVNFDREGPVTFAAAQADAPVAAEIGENTYFGGDRLVTVTAGQTVAVTDIDRTPLLKWLGR